MSFVSYAQNFEDVMLWRALKHIKCGFYIDIGAWSPDVDSVTRAFYERGWSGINVEPNPEFNSRLQERRPRDQNLRLAVGDLEGRLTMNFLGNPGLSTLDDCIANQHQKAGWSLERQEVQVTTLATLWVQNVPIGQDVHFLKVDVEGLEEAVLRGNDWTKGRPWVVVVEATLPMSQVESHEVWEPILIAANYIFAYADGLNRFYVAEDRAEELLPAFIYPPNVFDAFTLSGHRQAEARATDAEAKVQQAEANAEQAEAQAQQTVVRAQHAEAQAQQAIQALVTSRSWRITAPLRWFWLQLQMLRDPGVSTLIKALAEKVIRSAVRSCLDFLEVRPVARVRLVSLTRQMGLYQLLRGVFSRLSSNVNSANMSAEQQGQAQLPNELQCLLKPVIFKRHWPKQWVTETRRKILYVDISHLVQKDLKTGIQRVTRSIVTALMNNPPVDYQVKLVFATATSQGYSHANRYAQQLAGVLGEKQEDEPIDPQPGDIFLGLDFVVGVVVAQQQYLKWMHNRGVRMYFVVYDLLPTKLPQCFPEGTEAWHRQWLQTISKFDGAVCISRAVKDDLDAWLRTSGSQRHTPFDTGWFHLGADVENSLPTKGIPKIAGEFISKLEALPSFLMVGTVEPRKGHAQTLQAFELLWDQGAQVNLVIVGNQGWMVEELAKRLHKHPELNNRLFWLQGVSDEYLERIYAISTCLIAASEGEGFGLPLIEAAQHSLPTIARDIPVFREVAGENAFYFSGKEPEDMTNVIQAWLKLDLAKKTSRLNGIKWLTWTQSTQMLLDFLQQVHGKSRPRTNILYDT